MGELIAQEIEAVGGEVHDQQSAARGQHARGLAHGALGVGEEVQHLVHDDGVGRLVGDRQVVDISLADLAVGEARPLELGPGIGEHGRAAVEAEAAPKAAGEQLQHAARAGAEVDQQVEGPAAQHPRDGGFDLALGQMQRADAVPLAGMLVEVGLRRGLVLLAQGLQPLGVAGEQGIVRV